MGGRDPICHPNCLFRSPLPPYLPLSHIHTLSCPCWIFVCSRILWHQKPNCSELISLFFCFYFGFVSPRQSAKQPQQCKPLHPGWSKSGSRSNKNWYGRKVAREEMGNGQGCWKFWAPLLSYRVLLDLRSALLAVKKGKWRASEAARMGQQQATALPCREPIIFFRSTFVVPEKYFLQNRRQKTRMGEPWDACEHIEKKQGTFQQQAEITVLSKTDWPTARLTTL